MNNIFSSTGTQEKCAISPEFLINKSNIPLLVIEMLFIAFLIIGLWVS